MSYIAICVNGYVNYRLIAVFTLGKNPKWATMKNGILNDDVFGSILYTCRVAEFSKFCWLTESVGKLVYIQCLLSLRKD